MTTTINISLPKNMYDDAKKFLVAKRYTSISELVRDSLRKTLYEEITANGFTPEFEDYVLKSAAEPIENDTVWDAKIPFSEFVLKQSPKKRHGKNKLYGRVS